MNMSKKFILILAGVLIGYSILTMIGNAPEEDNVEIESTQSYITTESATESTIESTSTESTYHRNTSSKSTSTTYDSYDNGYEDVVEDDDYDTDRYDNDDDYASGVDDALDDEGE